MLNRPGLTKVLLVEDNPDDMEFIRRCLPDADFHFEHVELLAEAEDMLDDGDYQPDIVLLDLNLPDAEELEALVSLNYIVPEVPIVVLSGLATEGLALRAIQGQAQDYMVKSDLNPRSLSRAIRYAIERKDVEKQRQQTQKMQAVGQLTGGVAHDFNNLLGAMMLNLEYLQTFVDGDERGREALDSVSQAVRCGAALTQRLLAFSRQQVLQARTFGLNELIDEQFGLWRRTMPAHMEIETLLSEGVWPVHADTNQLENALLNLVINARDAMPSGGLLSISTANATLDRFTAAQLGAVPGDYVQLYVEDNGTGMTPDVLDRVLEPFYTTKEQGRGTGLGLSMVYGFVEQSGGYFHIKSQENVGTRIEILFPRGDADSQPAAQPEGEPLSPAEASKKYILVVEDSIDIQGAVVRTLENLGFHVAVATSEAEALRLIDEQDHLDILLTDNVLGALKEPHGLQAPAGPAGDEE
jgi:signal transduction histidine kinase